MHLKPGNTSRSSTALGFRGTRSIPSNTTHVRQVAGAAPGTQGSDDHFFSRNFESHETFQIILKYVPVCGWRIHSWLSLSIFQSHDRKIINTHIHDGTNAAGLYLIGQQPAL